MKYFISQLKNSIDMLATKAAMRMSAMAMTALMLLIVSEPTMAQFTPEYLMPEQKVSESYWYKTSGYDGSPFYGYDSDYYGYLTHIFTQFYANTNINYGTNVENWWGKKGMNMFGLRSGKNDNINSCNYINISNSTVSWGTRNYYANQRDQIKSIIAKVKAEPEEWFFQFGLNTTSAGYINLHLLYNNEPQTYYTIGTDITKESDTYKVIPRDGKWHEVDIPLSKIADEIGDFAYYPIYATGYDLTINDTLVMDGMMFYKRRTSMTEQCRYIIRWYDEDNINNITDKTPILQVTDGTYNTLVLMPYGMPTRDVLMPYYGNNVSISLYKQSDNADHARFSVLDINGKELFSSSDLNGVSDGTTLCTLTAAEMACSTDDGNKPYNVSVSNGGSADPNKYTFSWSGTTSSNESFRITVFNRDSTVLSTSDLLTPNTGSTPNEYVYYLDGESGTYFYRITTIDNQTGKQLSEYGDSFKHEKRNMTNVTLCVVVDNDFTNFTNYDVQITLNNGTTTVNHPLYNSTLFGSAGSDYLFTNGTSYITFGINIGSSHFNFSVNNGNGVQTNNVKPDGQYIAKVENNFYEIIPNPKDMSSPWLLEVPASKITASGKSKRCFTITNPSLTNDNGRVYLNWTENTDKVEYYKIRLNDDEWQTIQQADISFPHTIKLFNLSPMQITSWEVEGYINDDSWGEICVAYLKDENPYSLPAYDASAKNLQAIDNGDYTYTISFEQNSDAAYSVVELTSPKGIALNTTKQADTQFLTQVLPISGIYTYKVLSYSETDALIGTAESSFSVIIPALGDIHFNILVADDSPFAKAEKYLVYYGSDGVEQYSYLLDAPEKNHYNGTINAWEERYMNFALQNTGDATPLLFTERLTEQTASSYCLEVRYNTTHDGYELLDVDCDAANHNYNVQNCQLTSTEPGVAKFSFVSAELAPAYYIELTKGAVKETYPLTDISQEAGIITAQLMLSTTVDITYNNYQIYSADQTGRAYAFSDIKAGFIFMGNPYAVESVGISNIDLHTTVSWTSQADYCRIEFYDIETDNTVLEYIVAGESGTYNHATDLPRYTAYEVRITPVKKLDDNTYQPLSATYSEDYTPIAEADKKLLSVSAAVGGQVNTEVNGRYIEGTTVTIVATADAGWYFAQWSDGNKDATRAIVMDNDYTLEAQFLSSTKYSFAVKSADEYGKVESSHPNGSYAGGTKITIRAVANSGCRFVEWSDGDKSPERTITLLENISLEASFRETKTYTVMVEIRPSAQAGKILLDEEELEQESFKVIEDRTITLTARPASDYAFKYWEIDGEIETEKYLELKITKSVEIAAVFEKETGINDLQSDMSVSASNRTISVSCSERTQIEIFDITGQLLLRAEEQDVQFSAPQAGIYFVRTLNSIEKIIVE